MVLTHVSRETGKTRRIEDSEELEEGEEKESVDLNAGRTLFEVLEENANKEAGGKTEEDASEERSEGGAPKRHKPPQTNYPPPHWELPTSPTPSSCAGRGSSGDSSRW